MLAQSLKFGVRNGLVQGGRHHHLAGNPGQPVAYYLT